MAERTRASRRVALLAAAALAAAPALLIAGPAQAHNYLVSSTPAEGDTLTELPDRFDITTNEALLDLGGSTGAFALQVTDADGLYYGDGCLDITGPSLSTAAELGAPGTYTVQWQVVSADGHSVSDEFAFEWAPAAAGEEFTGSTAPPVCGEGDDSAAAGAAADEDGSTPEPAPTASDPDADSSTTAGASDTDASDTDASDTTAADADRAGGSSNGLWIGAAVVAAALAGGGVLFARSRGRGSGTTER